MFSKFYTFSKHTLEKNFIVQTNTKNIDNTNVFILSSKDASTTGSLDLLFGNAADELGLDNDRSVNMTSTEELEDTMLSQINNGSLGGILLGLFHDFFRENAQNFIKVHGGAEILISLHVEVSHTDLTEETRVARA